MDALSMLAVGWVIAIVGWVMSALVSKAVNALLEEPVKCIGKRLQLDAHDLLTRAKGHCTNNSKVKELVEELQQLTYGAENLLDEMDYYRLEHEIKKKASSSSGISKASILSVLNVSGHVKRFNLSRRMKKLDKELQKSIEEVRNAVGTENTKATELCQTSSIQTEPQIYGRKQELKDLINLLKNEKPTKFGKIPIVAIVGIGGVGKTTLAQLVFNDKEVRKHFHARFWIYVSSQFDMNRITREMLQVACGNVDESCNFNELHEKLRNVLVSKRFLLVLDDMWEYENRSKWDKMVAPLKDCMVKGSIILVTSRNKVVAEMINARDIFYLKGLEKDDFLKFLSKCIFDNEIYGGEKRLEQIGETIANKLECNPLAAKTVATMLKPDPYDVQSWINIRERDDWIAQSGPDDIMTALRLSYNHMPFHLQRCFSYCAMLPEDHTFTCKELVYLWMAQGFLNVRSKGKTMEDIGSDYFNDLLSHGFFQSKPSAYGGSMCYTFHDHLLHRFARMISFEECLRINGTESSEKIPPTIRHLSIFNFVGRDKEVIGKTLVDLKRENLSTVVNWDMFPSDIFQCIWDLLKKTQFVRAMRITLCSQVEPETLKFQNFVSLRYLRLIMSNLNNCNTLPKEICRLYHLEVFEIEAKLKELPNNFSNLVSLRHFIVKGELHSKIRGVGKLTSLQELNHFDVQQELGFEIEQLGSLKEIGGSLHIRNLENVKSEAEASMARLREKKKLGALYLQWNHGAQENKNVLESLKPSTSLISLTIDGYGGRASPKWLGSSMLRLESLTLKGCKAWKLLPPIGELELLKHLTLSELAVSEIGPQCYGTKSTIFLSLEELEIIDMPDLEKWVWSDQVFLRLKKLVIERCGKLVDLPLSGFSTSEVLKRFPSLETLIIENCPLISQLPQPPLIFDI